MAQNGSRVVVLAVDELTHASFRELANLLGSGSLNTFAAEIFTRGIEVLEQSLTGGLRNSPEMQLFRFRRKQARKNFQQTTLQEILMGGDLTEVEVDELQTLAETLGLDFARAELASTLFDQGVLVTDTKTGRCEQFLADLFVQHAELSKPEVDQYASQHTEKFTSQMLNQAKRALGIVSERRGQTWYWLRPERMDIAVLNEV